MAIGSATRIYECGKRFSIQQHRIELKVARFYSSWVRSLEFMTKEYDDQTLQEMVYYLKKYGFLLCTLPLPTKHSCYGREDAQKAVEKVKRFARDVYPEIYEALQKFHVLDQALIEVDIHPSARTICDIVQSEPGKYAVLLAKGAARFALEVEDHLSQFCGRKVKAISYQQLMYEPEEHLIVLGASRWHPEWVFNAPRTRMAHIVLFNWINDKVSSHLPFLVSSAPVPLQTPEREGQLLDVSPVAEDAEVMVPKLDWSLVSAAALTKSKDKDPKSLMLEAALIRLEGGYYVFADSSRESKILTLDPHQSTNEERLKRRNFSELQSGDFLVLRIEGGSDLLVPVADKILGSKAKLLRGQQLEWKRRLITQMVQSGATDIVDRLQTLTGGYRPSSTSVRYWASSNSHKTQEYSVFAGLMKIVGLEDKAKLIWEGATEIDRAHRMAGAKIRNLLLDRIKKEDMNMLNQRGILEFHLEAAGGGALAAFRIEEISEEKFQVPDCRIGALFKEDGLEWLE